MSYLNFRPVQMEFHVSRLARQRYQFDDALFSLTGNVIVADFNAARRFAQQINAHRDLLRNPEQAARAGEINAMGLIDEILHLVVQRYREQRVPDVNARAINWLENQLGPAELERLLLQFTQDFPPLPVHQGQVPAQDYLDSQSLRTDGTLVSNRELALEELIFLWLANQNPAYSPYQELFDDRPLAEQTRYQAALAALQEFFAVLPTFGPENESLLQVLRAPALAAPGSLLSQLEFIRTRWQGFGLEGVFSFLRRLLSSIDLIREETRPVFPGGGPGPAPVLEFAGQEEELERFSPDLDWMPNLVLMAKNSYVWLDQLSRKFSLPIRRLDQVPDEELDFLRRSGFTGLWLIGIWERSRASQRIKQMRGNPEAIASAYSLFSYDIADDLGGAAALQNLRMRCWQRGIRLAADMVPNHMGIDSRWVIEHPDWFISLDQCPFPGYTFNGPNLSWDERVGIYLEDHYYDSTDAAVVFKRVDFWTGSEKFIYHGNDGTSMPWNDTAQLNFLIPEVREAVIQTILHVARQFPVIRFDAAMTLAKRHYQRLWFPEPGSGGDIPSRAGLGLTKADFDRAMPEEFWRMVVERVAQEAPDTLLLAEAFWMMEGYFVRTLGMHRVYNSAFMNMLRDEKNQEYRLVIKNTLEFDPEILKRYVNFMNNPDERTAVDQFGKGDKYFGVCMLMATMPGLPMFGHGQLEGFTERYGMEYHRALWDESVDQDLLERHARQVFPLLRKRYLFAEVRNFWLFDFFAPDGSVNENVYAYTNLVGEERSLVLFHNRFAEAQGWIRLSAAARQAGGDGPPAVDDRPLVQRTLAEALNLPTGPGWYIIYRDALSGLEYLQGGQALAEKGLYQELHAYECRVYLNFRQVFDEPGPDGQPGQYAQLKAVLGGRGAPSIEEALQEMRLQPVLIPFTELVNAGFFRWIVQNRRVAGEVHLAGTALEMSEAEAPAAQAETRLVDLLVAIQAFLNIQGGVAPVDLAAGLRQELEALLLLPAVVAVLPALQTRKIPASLKALQLLAAGVLGDHPLESGDHFTWGVLLGWLFTGKLGMLATPSGYAGRSWRWFDELLFGKRLEVALQDWGLETGQAAQAAALVALLCREAEMDLSANPGVLLQRWLQDEALKAFWKVHVYQEILWFNKEAFQTWLWMLLAVAALRQLVETGLVKAPVEDIQSVAEALVAPETPFSAACSQVERLLLAEEESGYQVEKLILALKADQSARRAPSRKRRL